MDTRLFLIDGHALIFRMYYAFARRPMINSKGADMSILFGFTKYILDLIEREHPTHMAVAFDPPGGTFRNGLYPEYKANRGETPQLVIDSLEPLGGLCGALGLKVLMVAGYEADDVIGTVAKRFASESCDVYMVTPDKDYGQLLAPHIFQVKPGKSGGEDEILDSSAICGKYGISDPSQVIELLTLCGDASDNVPGVRGVGEIGAGKLISRYGTVDGIYAHVTELSARQQEMFAEAAGHISLSHELVTIRTDVPVSVALEDMALTGRYGAEAAQLFDFYEFSSLRRYLGDVSLPHREGRRVSPHRVGAGELTEAALREGRVALAADVEGGLFTPVDSLVAAVCTGGRELFTVASVRELAPLLENADVVKCGYGLKNLLLRLRLDGVGLEGRLDDIELMHYLVEPERSHRIGLLAQSYLGVVMDGQKEESEVVGSLFDDVEGQAADRSVDAAVSFLLDPVMRERMEKDGVMTLYLEIEEPLIRVLADMEYAGVTVDLRHLAAYAEDLRKELAAMEAEIREMADDPSLNVSSPKQVGVILFEKLKLDSRAKKGVKGGYSTDEATLASIAHKHPIVDRILEFREVKKLLSTYIDPFPQYVNRRTGKIHTTFNQALTSTGRLSSSNPNLQNIPIRSERGKEIRKAFIPSDPRGSILSADYSQIELRVMAHLCRDTHMIEAFREGVDVHRVTASRIFRTPYEEVSEEQRRTAKVANFGIMYGISSFGLAQRLKVSRSEAKSIIDGYFEAFPAIRGFIDRMTESAREKGYAETVFGRRRYLKDIASRNVNARSMAERNAVNAPIQGTAADIIKIAMVDVARRLEAGGFRSRMVLQIHDELLFDVYPGEEERLKAVVVGEMENVISLSVPLTAECGYGKNWLEAH